MNRYQYLQYHQLKHQYDIDFCVLFRWGMGTVSGLIFEWRFSSDIFCKQIFVSVFRPSFFHHIFVAYFLSHICLYFSSTNIFVCVFRTDNFCSYMFLSVFFRLHIFSTAFFVIEVFRSSIISSMHIFIRLRRIKKSHPTLLAFLRFK